MLRKEAISAVVTAEVVLIGRKAFSGKASKITQFYFDDIGMWSSVPTARYTRIDQSKGDHIGPDYPCVGEDALKTLYDIVRGS